MLFGLEQRNYILRRRQLFALQSQLLGRLPQLYSIAADDGRWHVQQGRVALVYHTECELPLCGDSRSSTTSAPASCLLLRLQCARWLLGRIVLEHDWLQHGCRIACLRLWGVPAALHVSRRRPRALYSPRVLLRDRLTRVDRVMI